MEAGPASGEAAPVEGRGAPPENSSESATATFTGAVRIRGIPSVEKALNVKPTTTAVATIAKMSPDNERCFILFSI